MKIFNYILALCLFTGVANAKEIPMKLKISFEDKTVVVALEDNSAVRQMISMLPADFEFTDFAGEEKISEFPKAVSLSDAPRGMVATAGKMFIYAPWGNFGIFYKNHGFLPDNSLIKLGEVESGLEYLANYKGGFSAKIEVIKGE